MNLQDIKDMKPGLSVKQKNGNKILIEEIFRAALDVIDDRSRYDLKLEITKRTSKKSALIAMNGVKRDE